MPGDTEKIFCENPKSIGLFIEVAVIFIELAFPYGKFINCLNFYRLSIKLWPFTQQSKVEHC
jgi:hypothetical protein